MNDRDIDIILALADGTLSGAAERDALARVAADPEFAAAYEDQLAAMGALEQLGEPLMTAGERSTMHAALIEELHLQTEPSVVPLRPRANRWRAALFGVASVAAVVLAFVIVPPMIGSSTDDSADVALAPVAESQATDGGGGSIASESSGDAFETAPEVTTTVAAGGAASMLMVPDASAIGIDELKRSLDTATSEEDGGGDLAPASIPIDVTRLVDCLDALGDDLPMDLDPIAASERDGSIIVYLASTTGAGERDLMAVALDDCRLVETP